MSKSDKKEKDQVEQAVIQEPEDEAVEKYSRYYVTAKVISEIDGPMKFDDLAIRCDDAYVAADPENHKSNIQGARTVLRDQFIIAPIFSNGLIKVEGDIISRTPSA